MNEVSAYAVVLGLATALVAGLVGSFALMKRMTLAGDVVSHLALPGLGLAFLWRIQPLVGAAATLAIGIVVIHQLQRRSGLATETAIGVVFVGALAVGVLFTPQEDLIDALFGGFAPINLPGFILGLVGCATILFSIVLLRQRLILVIFSPDLARSLKIDVDSVNFVYLCTFGLAILLGLQFLGALLVGALIIVPAAAGRQLAKTFAGFLCVSAICGALSVGAGFAVASHWRLALGPTIVGVACAIFAASLVTKSLESHLTT